MLHVLLREPPPPSNIHFCRLSEDIATQPFTEHSKNELILTRQRFWHAGLSLPIVRSALFGPTVGRLVDADLFQRVSS